MAYSFTEKKRIRNNFGSRESILTEPDLLAIQIESFNGFIQAGKETKTNVGLHAVFQSVFPITANNGYAEIEYVDYALQEPKFNVEECKLRGVTFASILRVKLNLVLFDKNGSILKKKRRVKQIIEEDVYLGQLPLMTDTGTFVINGTERVVVSQLHRSPGVIFEHDKGKTHSSGEILFSSRIIPYRGSWLDFEFDHHEHLYVRIDRRRKLPVTTLLRAMGLDSIGILDTFFGKINVKLKAKSCNVDLSPAKLCGSIAEFDIMSGKDVVVEKGRRITVKHTNILEKAGIESMVTPLEYLLDKVISQDLVDKETGEILCAANTVISEEVDSIPRRRLSFIRPTLERS
jgi:DNA-directed RNA polymerase subunit beta